MNTFYDAFSDGYERAENEMAQKILGALVWYEHYVGEVFALSYDYASVLIHDADRQQVGGIPSLCFLVATRINPDKKELEYKTEDASVILLRVMNAEPLPDDDEATRIRIQSAQNVTGYLDQHWDGRTGMDMVTHHLLSYAGVRCRVIGTFYLTQAAENPDDGTKHPPLVLQFGSDISNYYPNRGLKVYRPSGEALEMIVNYRDPQHLGDLYNQHEVQIGTVRYASTNRPFQGVDSVRVSIAPADLLGQKTALFGMTRTGKSNTTKVLAKSVFELRFASPNPLRVGQLIFDPDGEYANENAQDSGNALKNVWRAHPKGQRKDVVTYGILAHPNDPNRRLMLLNFFTDANLQVGKEIIDDLLVGHEAQYIQHFRQVSFVRPAARSGSQDIRYRRRVLVYRALLAQAGFTPSKDVQPGTARLFNAKLIEALQSCEGERSAEYQSAATILSTPHPTWAQLAMAFEALARFMREKEYRAFEEWYIRDRPNASGYVWADEDLKKLLTMFIYSNGVRQIGLARPQHTDLVEQDYADEIYEHLSAGRLVIVDQSSGDPGTNDASARRIMWRIFTGHRELFRQGKQRNEIPDVLVYAEEAHNVLPSSRENDLTDVWVRAAKEGAKYHLGLVYITQEVSSIQRNILANTANWFIGHLNSTDETRQLSKFYDFADFERSILRAQDRGFLRVKTLSNPYVVSVQVDRFEMPA